MSGYHDLARVENVTVTVEDFEMTFEEGIRTLLVSPSGENVQLVSGCGVDANTGYPVTWTLDGAAANSAPRDGSSMGSGTIYRPTVCYEFEEGGGFLGLELYAE